jgi:hypothetical protein
MTTSRLDDLLAFLEQRRLIRSEMEEAWKAWEKRLLAKRAGTLAAAASTILNEGTHLSASSMKLESAKQFIAATEFLSNQPLQEQTSTTKTNREFYSWGPYFDPVLLLYSTTSNTKLNIVNVTLGPSAMIGLRQQAASSQQHASTTALVSHKHPGLQVVVEQSPAPATSLSAAIAHKHPLNPFDVDVAQLHALCLYFVMDHTPCASLEYVPPYAAKITEVKSANISTNSVGLGSIDDVVQATEDKVPEPQMRVTLRMSRNPSRSDLLTSVSSPPLRTSTYTRPSYLLLSGDPDNASTLPEVQNVVGTGNSFETAPAAMVRSTSRASMLRRILPPDSLHTVSASGTEASKNPLNSSSVRKFSTNLPMSRNTIRPGIATVVDEDLLENEYNSLLQRLQEDERRASLEEQNALNVATPSVSHDGNKGKRRGSFEECSEESDDDEEEEGLVDSRGLTRINASTNPHVLAATATKLNNSKHRSATLLSKQGVSNRIAGSTSGSNRQQSFVGNKPGSGRGSRSASKSPNGRASRMSPNGSTNEGNGAEDSQTGLSSQRLSIKGLYSAKNDIGPSDKPSSLSAKNELVSGSAAAGFSRQPSMTSILETNEDAALDAAATTSLMHRLSSAKDTTVGSFGRLSSASRNGVSRAGDGWQDNDTQRFSNSPAPSAPNSDSPTRSSSRETMVIASAGSSVLLSQRATGLVDNSSMYRTSINAGLHSSGNVERSFSNSRSSWTQGTPGSHVSSEVPVLRDLKPSEIVAFVNRGSTPDDRGGAGSAQTVQNSGGAVNSGGRGRHNSTPTKLIDRGGVGVHHSSKL